MRFDLSKGLFLIFVIFALVLSLNVFGLSNGATTIVNSLLYVAMMAAIAILIIFVGRLIISKILSYVDESVEDGRKSSLYPIIVMVFSILVMLVVLYVTMQHFGFDLMVIVTSMGLVGLALTLSAQSTLSQLFAGIALLFNGTLKNGDIVRFKPDGDDRYTVVSVGTMNTTLCNTNGSEYITVPNNTVISSTLYNLTANNEAHEVIIHVTVGNGKLDFDTLSEKVLAAASSVEHVITDGSFPKPTLEMEKFQINDSLKVIVGYPTNIGISNFEGSAVTYRLKVYIDDANLMERVTARLTEAVSSVFPVDVCTSIKTENAEAR